MAATLAGATAVLATFVGAVLGAATFAVVALAVVALAVAVLAGTTGLGASTTGAAFAAFAFFHSARKVSYSYFAAVVFTILYFFYALYAFLRAILSGVISLWILVALTLSFPEADLKVFLITDFLIKIGSSALERPKSFLILLALLGPSFLGRVTVVRP